jgi:hypothetical protein
MGRLSLEISLDSSGVAVFYKLDIGTGYPNVESAA